MQPEVFENGAQEDDVANCLTSNHEHPWCLIILLPSLAPLTALSP